MLHVDGARISNAAAALGLPLRALTTDAGVDMLSFGGTKNGLLGAEAVVFLNPELAEGFLWLRKQSLQLASKMRFLAAQLDALLTDGLYLRLAAHANAMAARLAAGLAALPEVEVVYPVQADAVFARLDPGHVAALQRDWMFHVWDESTSTVRWMTAFDTKESDVDEFLTAIAAATGAVSV